MSARADVHAAAAALGWTTETEEHTMSTEQGLPTVDLKGKPYVLVVDRIKYFHEHHPNGCIASEMVGHENGLFIVRATVTPDVDHPARRFNGLSQAKLGGSGANREAALENSETSAVGRALGFLGIGVIDSIASADELRKADHGDDDAPRERAARPEPSQRAARAYEPSRREADSGGSTEKQRKTMYAIAKDMNWPNDDIQNFNEDTVGVRDSRNMTMQQASQCIEALREAEGNQG